MSTINRKKWTWAEQKGNRWNVTITGWQPRDGKRKHSRQRSRWGDEIGAVTWNRHTIDKDDGVQRKEYKGRTDSNSPTGPNEDVCLATLLLL